MQPDRADEMERVEAAGGRILNWNGSRVLGVLATSRSIGMCTSYVCTCSTSYIHMFDYSFDFDMMQEITI